MKLLMEYESVTQKVLLLIQSMLRNTKQLQTARLSWHVRCPSGVVSGLKIVGQGNPDNNLESHCTLGQVQTVELSRAETLYLYT
jgi:hypothetical protein